MLKADTGRLREPAALIMLAVLVTSTLVGIARMLISSGAYASPFGIRAAVALSVLVSPVLTGLAAGAVLLVTKFGAPTPRARLVALGSAGTLGLGVLFSLVGVFGVLFGDGLTFRDTFEYLISGLPMIAFAALGIVFAIRSAADLQPGAASAAPYDRPGQSFYGAPHNDGYAAQGQPYAPGLPQSGQQGGLPQGGQQGGHDEGGYGPGHGQGMPAQSAQQGHPAPPGAIPPTPGHPGQYGQPGQYGDAPGAGQGQQGQYGQSGPGPNHQAPNQQDHGQQGHGQQDHGQPGHGQQDHGQQDHGQQGPGRHGHGQPEQGPGQDQGQAAPATSYPQLPPPPSASEQQQQYAHDPYGTPYAGQDRGQGAFSQDRSQDPYADPYAQNAAYPQNGAPGQDRPAEPYGQPAQPQHQQQSWSTAEHNHLPAAPAPGQGHQPFQTGAHYPDYSDQYGATPPPAAPNQGGPGESPQQQGGQHHSPQHQPPQQQGGQHHSPQHHSPQHQAPQQQGQPSGGYPSPPQGPVFDQYGYAGQQSGAEAGFGQGAYSDPAYGSSPSPAAPYEGPQYGQQGGSPFGGYSGPQFAHQAAEQPPATPSFDSGFESSFGDGPTYENATDPREQQIAQAYQQAQNYQQQARPSDYSSGPTGPLNGPQDYQDFYDSPLGHPQSSERPAYPVSGGDSADQTVRFDPAAYQGDQLSGPGQVMNPGRREEPIDPTAIYAPDRSQAKYEEGSGSDQSGRGTDPNLPWYGSDR